MRSARAQANYQRLADHLAAWPNLPTPTRGPDPMTPDQLKRFQEKAARAQALGQRAADLAAALETWPTAQAIKLTTGGYGRGVALMATSRDNWTDQTWADETVTQRLRTALTDCLRTMAEETARELTALFRDDPVAAVAVAAAATDQRVTDQAPPHSASTDHPSLDHIDSDP